MATYTPYVRTNYFEVKDPEAFKAWCDRYSRYGLEMITAPRRKAPGFSRGEDVKK